MEIKTKLGTIVAQQINSKDYPGIQLTLFHDDFQMPMCLLEVDQYDPERPILKVHVWSPDLNIEEPVFDLREENMDKMFKG